MNEFIEIEYVTEEENGLFTLSVIEYKNKMPVMQAISLVSLARVLNVDKEVIKKYAKKCKVKITDEKLVSNTLESLAKLQNNLAAKSPVKEQILSIK